MYQYMSRRAYLSEEDEDLGHPIGNVVGVGADQSCQPQHPGVPAHVVAGLESGREAGRQGGEGEGEGIREWAGGRARARRAGRGERDAG